MLGVVKNLIDKDEKLSSEDKKILHDQTLEMYELQVKDRDSARKREIEVAKVRKFDFMFTLTGLVGLGTFCFLVYAIVYITIPEHNEKTFYTLIGLCEGITLSIFSFYLELRLENKLWINIKTITKDIKSLIETIHDTD